MDSYEIEWTRQHQDPMCDRYTIHTLWSFIDYLDQMVAYSRVNIRIHTALPGDTPMEHFDLVFSLQRPESYQPNQRFFLSEFPFALTDKSTWLFHLISKMIDALARLLYRNIVIHVFHRPEAKALWDHIHTHMKHPKLLTHSLGGFDLVHALKMDRTLFFDLYKDQRYLYKVKPYTHASDDIFVTQLPWHNVCVESRFLVMHSEQLWNKIPNLAPALIEWTDTQPEQLPLIPVHNEGILDYTPNTEYNCVYKIPISAKTTFLYDYHDSLNSNIVTQIKQFTQDLTHNGWYAAILNIGCFIVDSYGHIKYFRHEHLYKGADSSKLMEKQMQSLSEQLVQWRRQVGKKTSRFNWPRYLRNKQLLAIYDQEVFYSTSDDYILSIRSPKLTPYYFGDVEKLKVANGSRTYPPYVYDDPDPLTIMKRSDVILTLFRAKTPQTVIDYMHHHPNKRDMILQALVFEANHFIKTHRKYIDDYGNTLLLIDDSDPMLYYDFEYDDCKYALISVPFTINLIRCLGPKSADEHDDAFQKSCIALARTFNHNDSEYLLTLLNKQNISRSFPQVQWLNEETEKKLRLRTTSLRRNPKKLQEKQRERV